MKTRARLLLSTVLSFVVMCLFVLGIAPSAYAATSSQQLHYLSASSASISCQRTVTLSTTGAQPVVKQYPCSHYPAEKPGVHIATSVSDCRVPDGDEVCLFVSYTFSTDHSHVNIEYAILTGYSSANALYWDHSQYGAGWWGEGDKYIGTNSLRQNIYSTRNAGYTFEPWMKTSSGDFWYWDTPLR